MLGADGVLIGSRFWASDEALVPPGFKAAAVAAQGDDTIRTTVVDLARKIDWPQPFTARALKTRFTMQWHGREAELVDPAVLDGEMTRYFEAANRGDAENCGVLVGEAVALIRDVRPAGAILHQIVREAAGREGTGHVAPALNRAHRCRSPARHAIGAVTPA
jgi:nitronate monooxygenase